MYLCKPIQSMQLMILIMVQVWNAFEREQVLDIVDPTLEEQYPREQALRVITIALLCTQGSSALRPAMSEVVSLLTNNLQIPLHPTQPAFIAAACSSTTSSQGSRGSISMSLLPR
jgi:hypothetical protein